MFLLLSGYVVLITAVDDFCATAQCIPKTKEAQQITLLFELKKNHDGFSLKYIRMHVKFGAVYHVCQDANIIKIFLITRLKNIFKGIFVTRIQ